MVPGHIEAPADWFQQDPPAGTTAPQVVELMRAVQSLQATSPKALQDVSLDKLLDDERPMSGVQKSISQHVAEHRRKSIMASLSNRYDTVDRAVFLGAGAQEAGAWIFASTGRRGERMRNDVFRCAVRTRLGAHRLRAEGVDCDCNNKQLTTASQPHILTCKRSAGMWTRRHNMIRDELHVMLPKLVPNVTTYREPNGADIWDRQPGVREQNNRADVRVEAYGGTDGDATYMVDVTVVNPQADVRYVNERPRVTAMEAEKRKISKYEKRFDIREQELVPLAFEPVGAMGPAAIVFLKAMARRVAVDPKSYSYQLALRELYTRLSVALQRGNALVLRPLLVAGMPSV
jgi:hypothetical protein